jgi:RimJ/RimL family protein N-acetyltransferase
MCELEVVMSEQNRWGQPVGRVVSHGNVRPLPSAEKLKGRFCILTALDITQHADQLFDSLQIENNGESWTYLPYGPFFDKEAFRHWLHTLVATEKETMLYVILEPRNHSPIGICGYLCITPQHAVIEIGHVHFSKLLQKTPAATEAIYLMLRRAFETGYRRCEWKCDSLNAPSQQAARRFGFTFEGIFRQHMIIKDRNRDTAWFSMLDSEWLIIQPKFEKWLKSENFDASGQQKLNLMQC